MPDFDWVTERKNCSAAALFEKLNLEIKEDVAIRKGMQTGNSYYGYEFVSNGQEFSVLLEGNRIFHAVKFSLGNGVITVRDEDDVAMFRAVPTLSDDGTCRLKISDGKEEKELERWQFRKKALESLFFNEPRQKPEPKWEMQR